MTDTIPERWWEEHDEVVRLAHWLADRGDEAKNVAYAVEKPWKYEEEYRRCLADNAAEEAEAMHRLPGESYLGMLVRNRQHTPSVSFDTQDTSGAPA